MGKNDTYFAWSYPAQKFDEAAGVLARSFAPGWQRMEWALLPLLSMLPAHFPDQGIYQHLEKLLEHATNYGPLELNGRIWRGSLEHTLRRRKRVTLERYAREIMNLLEEVERRRGEYQYN